MNTKGPNAPLPGSTYHLERNSNILGRALEDSWRRVVSADDSLHLRHIPLSQSVSLSI